MRACVWAGRDDREEKGGWAGMKEGGWVGKKEGGCAKKKEGGLGGKEERQGGWGL